VFSSRTVDTEVEPTCLPVSSILVNLPLHMAPKTIDPNLIDLRKAASREVPTDADTIAGAFPLRMCEWGPCTNRRGHRLSQEVAPMHAPPILSLLQALPL
jgi:hypothetical protein